MRCGAVGAVWYPGARTSSTYWCFGGAPKKTPVSGLVGAHPLVALVVADGELDLAHPLGRTSSSGGSFFSAAVTWRLRSAARRKKFWTQPFET